jgi:ABC-2 type transport system permease protein
LILGGAFLPTSLFPKKLLEIAKFNPIYHMNEALLGVWASGKDLVEIQEHFWFLWIFALVMVAGGWLSYQRMLRVERRL